jgi:twitching motility two-component system response regulator PilH
MNDAAAPTVLIIGDDENFRYLMRRYVTESGCRALVEQHVAETMGVARREKPSAVFLEVGSPRVSGPDLLRLLKQDETTQDIPVIVCFLFEEEAWAQSEGAASHLKEPILYRDVLTALSDVGVQAH